MTDVIANQSADWCGNLLKNSFHISCFIDNFYRSYTVLFATLFNCIGVKLPAVFGIVFYCYNTVSI